MTTAQVSGNWQTLCPVNFLQFKEITQTIGNIEAVLLLSKLKFHETHSKLKSKKGTKCITRTRDVMAKWFGFSLWKIDRMLNMLESKGLIKTEQGSWYGKKQLFVSTSPDIEHIPTNIQILEVLTEEIKSTHGAILFSRIAFGLNITKIQHNSVKWFCLTREEIAALLCKSLRTVDTIIDKLENDGLISTENFVFKGQRRLHFTISEEVFCRLSKKLLLKKEKGSHQKSISAKKHTTVNTEINPQKKETPKFGFCRFSGEEPAKTKVPIRLSTNSLKENNNTKQETAVQKEVIYNAKDQSDINLNKIDEKLNERQRCFLIAAFKKTVKCAKLENISEKEIMEEIKYSILNPEQRKGVLTFKHAVSRCMQLLRQGTWRTPFGFNRYTEYGKDIKAYREVQLQAHKKLKEEECQQERKTMGKTDTYTVQAIRWAQQLSAYFQEMQSKIGNNADFTEKIEFAASRVVEFIDKGADRMAVKPYLPAGVLA